MLGRRLVFPDPALADRSLIPATPMAISLPQFNLLCNIYDEAFPPPHAPRILTLPCQLYVNSRVPLVAADLETSTVELQANLRVPWNSDIREGDWVEMPSLPFAFRWWTLDDPLPVHAGFPNQYYSAAVQVVSDPSRFFILLETGFYVLLESGPPDRILLE